MSYHSVTNDEAKRYGLINVSHLLYEDYGWKFNDVSNCKNYEVVTLQNQIVVLSKHKLNFRYGKIKTDVARLLFKNTKIYFDPEYLIKTEKPIFRLLDTIDEDDLDIKKKIMWTHETQTYCWPKEELYEAVGEILIIKEYDRLDRSIECVCTTGKFIGKEYKFPVFCLMLPEAIYLKKEPKFFGSNLYERLKCNLNYLNWRLYMWKNF